MRALVLSGGGALGAFQVGALRYLLADQGRAYDILAGTSVGSINAAALAQYEHGREVEAFENLHKLWLGVKPSKIYRKWYFGLLGSLPALWKPSVYNTKPVRRLIEENLDWRLIRNSGKKLRVGAVSISTGQRRIWTELDESIAVGVQASSAFPIAFEPVEFEGQLWTDDGIRETTPIAAAIDAGASSIDVIQTFPAGVPGHLEGKTAMKLALRQLEIMLDEIDQGDVQTTELYNALVRADAAPGKVEVAVNVLKPSFALGDSLDFSPASIRTNIDRGYEAAKAHFEQ